MLGDEGMELCGVLLGLNAIDFGSAQFLYFAFTSAALPLPAFLKI